jgi:hypothetical protein
MAPAITVLRCHKHTARRSGDEASLDPTDRMTLARIATVAVFVSAKPDEAVLRVASHAPEHDLENRTHGLIDRTRMMFDRDRDAPDAVTAARVRSKLGRMVSHPRAISVIAHDGRVELSGAVLASEADHLLAEVASVRGVAGVENRFQVYEHPGDHPALRQPTRRARHESQRTQVAWSPTKRLLASAAIAVPTLRAVFRGGPRGLALGALGFALALKELGRTNGRSRRRRNAHGARPPLATGAPVHDVTFPFRQPRLEAPDIGL